MAAKTSSSSKPKHCPAARAASRSHRHTARLPQLRLERSGAKNLLTKFETAFCNTNLALDKTQWEATPRFLSTHAVRRSERQLANGARQTTFHLKAVAEAVAQAPTEAVSRRRRRHHAPLKFSLSCEGYSVPAKAICGTNDPDAYWDVVRANGDPLIIDLGGIARVDSLTIQGATTQGGRHSAWVKKFRLQYQSGTETKTNQVSKWSSTLVLEGNDDATSLRYHTFCDAPGGALQTRFLRVVPLETIGGGALRIAFCGSLLVAPPKQYKIPNSSTRTVAYTITEPADSSQSAAKESQSQWRYTAGKAGNYANVDVADAMEEYMGAQLDAELEWSDHSDETQLELPFSPAEVELSLKEYLSSTPALSASSRSGSEWGELPEEMEEWCLVDPLC